MSDEELFIGYEVSTGVIPAFFIESTAPVNIDDRDGKALPIPDGCARLPSVEDAVEKIAMKLLEQKEPKLVITVHGFNSPRESVLKYYTNSFLAVDGDDAIRDRGVVCMGYRWPSELSTPEQKCVGWPEQKYIGDAGRKAPNWGPFLRASGLGRIIHRGVSTGAA